MIHPAELKFSAWNTNTVSPDDQKKLEESLRRNGQFRPVIVRDIGNETFEVIAGEHTTRAAIALGWEEIAIYNLGQIDERKAKEISVLDNSRYGHDDATDLAALLREIAEEDELKSFLPVGDEDLAGIFATQDIDLDDLDIDPDESNDIPEDAPPSKTHQLLRFKVPVQDAEFVEDQVNNIMKTQGFSEPDSLSNAGNALVYILNHWGPK